MAKKKTDLDSIEGKLNARAKLILQAEKDLEGYLKLVRDTQEIESSINELYEDRAKFIRESAKLRQQIIDLGANGNAAEIAALKEKRKTNILFAKIRFYKDYSRKFALERIEWHRKKSENIMQRRCWRNNCPNI